MKARIKELLEQARKMKFQPSRRRVKRQRPLSIKERNELVSFFDFHSICYRNLSLPDVRLPRRFWQKITPLDSGCWEWIGSKWGLPGHLYGEVRDVNSKRKTTAHRAVYQIVNGVTVPKGHDVDHLCGNKLCVNPDHLQAVSHQENCRRRFIRVGTLQETRVSQ